jgi:predicted dehydrogenase
MSSKGIAAVAATGNFAFAQGSETIKVGLVGCGGRGRDAINNVVAAAPGVEIWAVGDAFQDRVDMALDTLSKMGDKNKVTKDRAFAGLDAYKQVIDSGVNYVILTTPPGYRPQHLRYAIEKGKHVFAEKPVATCPVGARHIMESAKMAAQKNLGIAAGTQRRHQLPYVETIKRIHEGAMGEVLSGAVYWNQGGMWFVGREPRMNDVEWMLRNWQYFTAIGGDHIVEQHIHNLDVANWVMNAHPVRALGMGGRQVRTDANYGHVYDHFAVEFEYPNGVKVLSTCRQQDGTQSRVGEFFKGTKGTSTAGGSIQGENRFRYDGPNPNPYVNEHTNLINSIRAGKPLNEGRTVAESTLTAIMGRESAYSGQEVTWEEMMKSTLDLRPDKLRWGSMPMPVVAMPGQYKMA